MHQKIKFISMKIHNTVATRAALFGPDMHQIVCRLGLHPRPHWGSLQRSPRPLAGLRGPTSKGRGEEGMGGRGGDGFGPPLNEFLDPPLKGGDCPRGMYGGICPDACVNGSTEMR